MKRNSILFGVALFVVATPAFAAPDSTAPINTSLNNSINNIVLNNISTNTLNIITPSSFCDNIENLTTNVRSDAIIKASEHRVELEKLSSEREEVKKKQTEQRAEVRQKEDLVRESVLEVFRARATTQIAKDAVERFGSTTGKLLKELRISTDKAREDYAKVIRNVSLAERTKRNKALDAYVDKLDKANDYAEEQCAKGANDAKVMISYNTWLKTAKDELAKNLSLQKSTLEQRAKLVHERELNRLESDYRRKIQKEIQILTEKFPELLVQPLADVNANIQNQASTSVAN